MNTIEVIGLLAVIAFCIIGMMIGAFFYGFHRGAQFHTQNRLEQYVPDPQIIGAEAQEEMQERGYLDMSTSPVIQVAGITSLEIVAVPARELEEEHDLIASLTAQLARAERLRKRYLRLLRQERAMMLDTITGVGTQLTPYWRRWVHDHFSEESPFWLSPSWARIANIS